MIARPGVWWKIGPGKSICATARAERPSRSARSGAARSAYPDSSRVAALRRSSLASSLVSSSGYSIASLTSARCCRRAAADISPGRGIVQRRLGWPGCSARSKQPSTPQSCSPRRSVWFGSLREGRPGRALVLAPARLPARHVLFPACHGALPADADSAFSFSGLSGRSRQVCAARRRRRQRADLPRSPRSTTFSGQQEGHCCCFSPSAQGGRAGRGAISRAKAAGGLVSFVGCESRMRSPGDDLSGSGGKTSDAPDSRQPPARPSERVPAGARPPSRVGPPARRRRPPERSDRARARSRSSPRSPILLYATARPAPIHCTMRFLLPSIPS